MPTVRAISGELDTARMAWPQRERLRNSIRATIARYREDHREHVQVGQEHRADDERGVEHADVHAHRIGREHDREQVLDQDEQPERGDEQARAQGPALLQLLVQQQIDQQTRGRGGQDGGDHRYAQRQVQQLLPDVGEVGRQREHRTVRHVEVQRGAVDQAPAQRAQRIEAAHHQPGGEKLEQQIHANAPATL